MELQFRARGGIVSLFNFGKVSNFAKVYTAKMTYRSFRKISEKFGRGEGEFLIKKGYEKGGGSL